MSLAEVPTILTGVSRPRERVSAGYVVGSATIIDTGRTRRREVRLSRRYPRR